MPEFSKALAAILDNSEELIEKSRQSYVRDVIKIDPHLREHAIDSITIYRKGMPILRAALPDGLGPISSMWLGFPYRIKGHKRVHTWDGDLEDFIPASASLSASPFVNFDGDAIPEVVVCHDNENAGNQYTVYSLGPKARVLGVIDAWRSCAQFVDVDGDGRCEALARDTTFLGWHACNAGSPMPLVVLKAGRSRLELSPSVMRAAPPSAKRQREILAAWSNACRPDGQAKGRSIFERTGKLDVFTLSPVVWGDMLHLIYSGNSNVAFRLLDRFWPRNAYTDSMETAETTKEDCSCKRVYTSKARFVKMFLGQIRHSPYIDELRLLNRGDKWLVK
ncbi:MAG: hypothetical protein JST01_25385 [Cyanobacteria bacterium SZAS TMP-1]|nr:hypothetical protein [Cyanobacteria bacterium SZAS TMP-1]